MRMAQADAPVTIRLAELLGALSHALDLVEGQPQGHCIRCCWIGLHVGRDIGLGEAQLRELYYTLLLKDLGCSSNAARMSRLYLTDEIALKRDFKILDGSLPQALRLVLAHTGAKAGLIDRVQALISVISKGKSLAREFIETRCHRGADIARRMRFSECVAAGIQDLNEHWDGGGMPRGLRGMEISLYARIGLLTQVADVFHTAGGPDAARSEIEKRAGSWFEPALVMAFRRVAANQHFWTGMASNELAQRIFALEPAQHSVAVDEDYLDDISAAFAEVVDSKSPFTSGHSERVTRFSDVIAAQLGLPANERRWLRRAALLHDIGKLGVSNAILDKPGKLDPDEWEVMKLHPAHTEMILGRITAFGDLAPIAGAHHERLDGKGYPHGLAGNEIARETRIITAADIFDALTADRPYRPAMPVSKALAIMDEMVGTAIDAECYAALRAGLRRGMREVEAAA
jgi:HD-GYP domain-containing protein (c-di-GMP phosphodiesterase class II)